MQIGEILRILPNNCLLLPEPKDDKFIIRLLGTEIPKWLNLNHESDGNAISFWVGHKFPKKFYVCFAFGPVKYPRMSTCIIYLSINGCEKENLLSTPTYEFSDHLWIFSLPNKKLQYQHFMDLVTLTHPLG